LTKSLFKRFDYFKPACVWLLITFLLPIGCGNSPSAQSEWEQLPVILNRIVPPLFPNKDFNVLVFGAAADGKTDCTEAFRQAIEACHAAGGGQVIVPEGIFLTGAIHLKSNVNLVVKKNATILFSQEVKKYLPVVFTRFEGIECKNYSPFIYACQQENIAITGEGTLDGQADSTAWWPWAGNPHYGWREGFPHQKSDQEMLNNFAEAQIPVDKRIFGQGHYLRVNFIQPYKCKNVLIEGITIRRSPMWEINPVLCENVTVKNVTVISHGPNNDGCNPESSKDVLIKNCYFDTGDDCIAIKSGRNADGRRVNRPSEYIVIQNCIMKDGHGGVVIGSETSGSCRNVFVEDCLMDSPNLERALRIKTNSLRGGIVENIFMRHITVGEVSDAVILIHFYYSEGDIGQHTPIVRHIYANDVTSQKSNYALSLEGYERSPILNVNLDNCRFNNVKKGNRIDHVVGLKMKNVYLNGKLIE